MWARANPRDTAQITVDDCDDGGSNAQNYESVLTLEMMMPAMEILTLGPFRSLYLRSMPFQKEMTYRLMAMLSFPCSLHFKFR